MAVVVAVVGAVVGRQIEPARARQCHVKTIQLVLGRSQDAPGPPRASRTELGKERLGSVSGDFWSHLGTFLELKRDLEGSLEAILETLKILQKPCKALQKSRLGE